MNRETNSATNSKTEPGVGRARGFAIGFLLLVGSLQSLGHIVGMPAIRGLGMAWVASPLPLVFSHFRGLETFSSDFAVRFTTEEGESIDRRLDPQTYGQLGGPYNRRNVYGAIAAYGPKLTEGNERKLVSSVLSYGFCSDGPLAQAAQVTGRIRSAELRVTNRYSEETLDASLGVQCP